MFGVCNKQCQAVFHVSCNMCAATCNFVIVFSFYVYLFYNETQVLVLSTHFLMVE